MKTPKKLFLQILYIVGCFSCATIHAQFNPSNLDSLGAVIEIALNEREGAFDQYFDRKAFVDRIILQNPKRSEIKKLNKSMKQTFARFSISNVLYKSPVEYSFKYIGTKKDSSMVIRQWDPNDAGFNYLLFKADYIEGAWVIVDVYVLLNAEYISKTLKNSIYMPAVIRLIDKKRGRKSMSNFEIYAEAGSLFRKEEYQLAYTKISNIPLEERQRIHQIFKINMSSYLDDDDRYYRSIDEFKERFPNDPSVEMILMDKYLVEGAYSKLYGTLDAIEEFVLHDNFLNYYRSLIYYLETDYKKAEVAINKAIELDAWEEVYHWMLVQIKEGAGDYKTCIKLIKEVGQQFGYNKRDLIDHIEAEFYLLSLSKPYKRWCKQKK